MGAYLKRTVVIIVMEETSYPRVLVVCMGRINAADSSNNGLLVRNLFGEWPKDCLAQVFSGGDNGDAGFFGHYYQLGKSDRLCGTLYHKLKQGGINAGGLLSTSTKQNEKLQWRYWIRNCAWHYLVDTGLYELFFLVRLSAKLKSFVDAFSPQMIFMQGYSLNFTRLSMQLAAHSRTPIIYYPTDDWAESRYNPLSSQLSVFSWFARRSVLYETRRLVDRVTIPIAFNHYMRDVYRERYGKNFNVLMHGDEAERFRRITPRRDVGSDQLLIVCTGEFDTYRWDLLKDMDEACVMLKAQGIQPCVMVYPVNYSQKLEAQARCFRHVRLAPCPKHDDLAAVLMGADILFLPERFGPDVWRIRSSVSSKAHLFMFSGGPIIVYSNPSTGVARYAKEYGWARVVDRRDPTELARVIKELAGSNKERQLLADNVCRTINANHNLSKIRKQFLVLIQNGLT